MATALHEVQANLTTVSSCTGGGESRGTLLALLGIRSSRTRCRNHAKCLIYIITLSTLCPTLLLTEEGPVAQRGRALAQGHTVS